MKDILLAFKERKEFKTNTPWSAVSVSLDVDNFVTPPHYAETIELNIYHNVIGDAYICGQHFTLNGNHAFFIAPNIIHSMNYQRSSGYATLLKINPVLLRPLLDLDILLKYNNKSFFELPIIIPEFDTMLAFEEVFKSGDINDVVIAIMQIFKLLISYSNEPVEQLILDSNDSELRSIILWTEENYTNKISLNDVSSFLGYSTNYFSKKFKKLTGITYLTYLNHLRIQKACGFLKRGYSVSQTCDVCGFDDMSYFVQLFKKITGTTPKKYSSSNKYKHQ